MKKHLSPIIIFLVLLANSVSLNAQTFPFRTYSIEDGLSESVVNDIIQDEDGFIWMATGYGLNRFDGNNFLNLFEESGLNNGKLHALMQSRDGKIWIGTEEGLNYMEDDSIYTDDRFVVLRNSKVISIFEDNENHLWVGTDGDGVWHFPNGENPVLYSTIQGLGSNDIRAIAQSENGDIWFATRFGLTRLSQGNLRTYNTLDGLPENRIRDIKIDSGGVLWIGTRNGLARFDGSSFSSYGSEDGLKDPRIQSIEIGDEGSVWLATEGGVSRFKDGTFENYTTAQGLSINIVYSSFIDREGNIWFGTFGGGVSLFLGDYFRNYGIDDGLPNELVTSITEDEKGKLWIATYGGGITHPGKDGFEVWNTENGLPDDRIYHLSNDTEGKMWIGMRDGLAYIKDDKVTFLNDEGFPFRKIRHVMQHSNGDYWVSSYDSGLVKMNRNGMQIYKEEDGLLSNTTLATVEDDEGAVWVATYGGVTKITEDNIVNYTLQEGLPNNAVMSIIKDREGAVWVSTFGGVSRFNGQRFVSITEEDGLSGRVCYFIKQDSEGYFWIGTNNGVSRLDAEKYFSSNNDVREQAIQNLTKEQGLISNETNLGAVYQSSQGELWFGTVEGVSRFEPNSYRGNRVAPKVHIAGIDAAGRRHFSHDLVLSHDRNFIEIQFSAINFTAPNQVIYEYQMSDIDPEWQRTSSHSARYPSLPPGEYFFRVHARNSNGIWSEEMAVIHIEIQPPFWMSWWFILLNALIIGGIVYLFYRNYQYMKMVDIERMRVRIASDLHDDVGASLTEIALQSDFLQASNMDSQFKQSLTQIGKQCRRIVTSLDDIVWSIDARNDTLGDLTDRMQDYILNVLEPRDFNVEYNFSDLNMENKLPVSVKENLYLIFKEAVNNIAKYSNGNIVKVSMNSRNGSFNFIIHDDGDSAKGLKKTGQGLRNMEMRANRIGGQLDIDDSNGFTIALNGKLNVN